MDSPSLQSGPAAYLESLMRAGQQATKQFDDALAAAMGVEGKPAKGEDASPFAAAANLQQQYWSPVLDFWRGFLAGTPAGANADNRPARDRRFKDEAWQQSPFYDLIKNSYLATAKQMADFVDQAQVDDKSKLQLRFYARQFIDAMSPSNFPATNPDVIRTAIQTRATSLVTGMQNLIEDLQKGRITRVDESAFEVGRNLASTPGSVIFENELIQLIQYTPTTAEVEKTPLVIVPPCINKYYLLDLGAGNSFVEYAVAQGHQVFLISWRSAVSETQYLTWDDYLNLGPLKAIDVARDIAGVEKVHALGFCVGGTILGCAAGVLAARGEDKIATMTLLTTMIDFADTGEIGLLIDDAAVAMREATIGSGGILPGKELAFTFGTLRANDLIWRYVVDSYLKGRRPRPLICFTGIPTASACRAQCIAGIRAIPMSRTSSSRPMRPRNAACRSISRRSKHRFMCWPLAKTISCLGRAPTARRTSSEKRRVSCWLPAVTLPVSSTRRPAKSAVIG